MRELEKRDNDLNRFLRDPSWDKVAHQNSNDIVCVLGPQNVGKSTFVNYLLNTMISGEKDVYLLDLDCGQPNFVLPG